MVPGYAKPREELPWLPYRESDKVFVINSHNLYRFSPAVNGKMPVAAWIPSRDTEGQNTVSVTDFVDPGLYPGTLTNMDAATDWVSDTDAGGSVALDLDGSNDHIRFTGLPDAQTFSAISISVWAKRNLNNSWFTLLDQGSELAGPPNFAVNFAIRNNNRIRFRVSNGTALSGIEEGSFAIGFGSWNHFVATWDGTTTTNTMRVYLNGVLAQSATATFAISTLLTGRMWALGGQTSLRANGRFDDWRLFGQSLDASDVADLYASGLGRGVDAS